MRYRRQFVWSLIGLGSLLVSVLPSPAKEPALATAAKKPALPRQWVKTLKWRSIGPASMGGRITAVTVCPRDPNTWWIATASGGLLKTTNNGITFTHQFDHEDAGLSPRHFPCSRRTSQPPPAPDGGSAVLVGSSGILAHRERPILDRGW